MTRGSKIRTVPAAASALVWAALACAGEVAGPSRPAPVASVTVSPATAVIVVRGTEQLSVVLRDARGNTLTDRAVTWMTSDSARVVVEATGLVTALTTGGASITATSEGQTGSATITSVPGPAAQISFDRDSLVLDAIADTAVVVATVRDAFGNTTTDPITWRVTDSAVVRVDVSGRVRSVGAGRTTVHARAGAIVDSVVVAVTPVARSVALATDTLRFSTLFRTLLPPVSVRDRNGVPLSAPDLRWRTTDSVVASVAVDGTLTALAPGSTFVVVEVDALRDSAVVVVRQIAARVVLSSAGAVLDVGASSTMTASTVDSGGTAIAASPVAQIMSRDPGVASVDRVTGLVRGLAEGSTVVVASGAADSTLTDTVAVVVVAPGSVIGRATIPAADPLGVAAGTALVIRITIDASRLPQAGAIAAAEATLRWDPTVFALDSLRHAPNAAAHQTALGVVAVAYAGADAVIGGSVDLATLYVRVLSSVTAGRNAGLLLTTPYSPIGLDFEPIGQWAALSDRVRSR